MVCSRLFD